MALLVSLACVAIAAVMAAVDPAPILVGLLAVQAACFLIVCLCALVERR